MSTSVSEHGRELIAAWSGIDRCVRTFVLELEEFNASCTWAEDGHTSCVSWLADKCEMSRSDAFEKLKVSRELCRRHVLRVAFEEGLAYSKVRVLVRLRGIDHERDEQFVAHARSDSIRVLEERVGNWNYYDGQDDKPTNLDDRYGITVAHGFGDAMGRVVFEAPNDMIDAFMATVDGYGEVVRRNAARKNGEQSTLWTDAGETLPEEETRPRFAQRLDWLLDLVQEAKLAEPHKFDAATATVGVTIQYEDLINKSGGGLSSQGSTLTPEAVWRLMCDAGVLRILVKGQSEILDFGRDERLFPRAVRRAIRFRHGHVCAVRGCGRRHTHIHHLTWWEDGGETSIDNGIPLCPFHHHLVHEGGWAVAWNPTTGVVTLEGPRGQILRTTASFLRAA